MSAQQQDLFTREIETVTGDLVKVNVNNIIYAQKLSDASARLYLMDSGQGTGHSGKRTALILDVLVDWTKLGRS